MPAPKGNRNAEAHSLDGWTDIFNQMLEKAKDDENDYLCLQEAFLGEGLSKRTFYDLCEKNVELHSLKEDMMEVINSRVNRLAIKNEGNATACIWRMKQLGEVDSRDLNSNHSGRIDSTQEHKVTFENYEIEEEDKDD